MYFTKIRRKKIRNAILTIIFAFLFSLISSTWSHGRFPPPGAPNIGSITRDVQRARPNPEPGLEESVPSPVIGLDLAGQKTILVKGFQLENFGSLSPAKVQKVLEPYKNQNLSLSQLNELTVKIADLYRQAGLPDVLVFIPPQDPSQTNNIVTIKTNLK
ncbi:MAG: hypothetical protein LBS60_05405 [Deltaproteobacteria bacterium]|jgi:hemolysin activation/secretion protein|nr:hypothetical protein [Deltaproteobacteria bacterium]